LAGKCIEFVATNPPSSIAPQSGATQLLKPTAIGTRNASYLSLPMTQTKSVQLLISGTGDSGLSPEINLKVITQILQMVRLGFYY
jgi:hypothetical protein